MRTSKEQLKLLVKIYSSEVIAKHFEVSLPHIKSITYNKRPLSKNMKIKVEKLYRWSGCAHVKKAVTKEWRSMAISPGTE